LDTPQSLAFLEQGRKEFPQNPLLDLELLRRRAGLEARGAVWEPGRVISETWTLLGRYPETEDLYQWGAWYFDYQRQWDETARLLKIAARHQFGGSWIRLHEALSSMEQGDLDQAGEILRAIPSPDWTVYANLGRIFEARSRPAYALEYYETAASMAPDQKEAARILIRVARCLRVLDRPGDSRRTLEYALDLDPDSLSARLELRRLDVPGIQN
jgi:tetratricopeptide (TPR) repeat protein